MGTKHKSDNRPPWVVVAQIVWYHDVAPSHLMKLPLVLWTMIPRCQVILQYISSKVACRMQSIFIIYDDVIIRKFAAGGTLCRCYNRDPLLTILSSTLYPNQSFLLLAFVITCTFWMYCTEPPLPWCNEGDQKPVLIWVWRSTGKTSFTMIVSINHKHSCLVWLIIYSVVIFICNGISVCRWWNLN